MHGYQPSISPFMRIHWPVCSLCPEITSLYRHTLQEVKRSLEQLEKLHHKISEDMSGKYFSPEELSVKQVGRKLQVSGKTEKKQEDGEGCYSYRIQEFIRVFDLPEGVNPETVSCFRTDGKLYIQTSEAPERMKTIDCIVNTTQPETENTENNVNETHKTDQSSEKQAESS
ncbi:Heat shock protein 30 [Triplophysa tibetana]|uniref:Heat shock protein 30 n=1 Tax=Triplophysa tibetana TaxID=1572043 RepID=A0A5A9N330_9TELE|nr:Heat shock protein 30 [Triplophysa tibetana]